MRTGGRGKNASLPRNEPGSIKVKLRADRFGPKVEDAPKLTRRTNSGCAVRCAALDKQTRSEITVPPSRSGNVLMPPNGVGPVINCSSTKR